MILILVEFPRIKKKRLTGSILSIAKRLARVQDTEIVFQ